MKKLEAWAISAAFAALITIPAVVFAAGVRPEPNQNRPPTPLPELSVAGILGRDLTPQLDAYLEDALIIAPGAAAAAAWTDVALGDSPSEKVTLGSSGWLYYTLSLNRPCLSPPEVDEFAETIARAERVVEATGRTLVVAVAPDKATIIPEFLPNDDTCVDDVADALGQLSQPASLLTVWDEMRAARARPRPIYFRLDTHWTHEGASVMSEAIVEAVLPDRWDPNALHKVATVEHEGDLTVLLGLPSTEPTDELETELAGRTQTRESRAVYTAAGNEHESLVAIDFSTNSPSVIEGDTLVMHDSFGWALIPTLSPYFDNVTFIRETNPGASHMSADLVAAQTIIHVVVQRSVHEVVLDLDLAAGFLSAYADDFESFEDGVRETGESLELAAPVAAQGDVYVVVALAAGSEGAEATYNGTTAVLTPDSPRAAFFVGSGGTMTFAGKVDYRLVATGK